MDQLISKNQSFLIRRGEQNDLDQLLYLNNKWCYQDLSIINHDKGFLFGNPFRKNEFQIIIENREIVVVEQNSKIGGYYLFDNFSDNETSRNYEEKLEFLVREGIVNYDKICRRAQALVDTDFQGFGLYRKLYTTLNDLFKNKYDSVFSLAHKKNPKLDSNFKLGWKVLYEEGDILYVMYDLVPEG